jgi:sugar (pentulose or hexulose) kinase
VANVTGLDVYVSKESDSASLGAAIIAASEGSTERLAALSKRDGAQNVTSPDSNREYYAKKYAAYLQWRATQE